MTQNPTARTCGAVSGHRFLLLSLIALCFAWSTVAQAQEEQGTEPFILQAQDRLQLSFPGAPELDTQMVIRRDGILSAPIIGEVLAVGITPAELEAKLAARYEDQLVSNEVNVVVLESFFTYYLEGEVNRPGIITSVRQLSVLEAIIAAGGINKNTGKHQSVVVIRREGNRYVRFEKDLKAIIQGKSDDAFVLQSYDVVSIPQRIW